ncbi:MAG: DUF3524 domain-containing protein [Actinomyces sp.]|nr:MAG: DUF3524 domain-containing protein [Actinomyces sp.]
MMPSRDVVVVEAWAGGSHRAWLEGWRRHSRHRITPLTLPGRAWRWRMRGGAVTLAEALADHVARHGRPDLVVATDMVDVAALAGLARRALGPTPVVTLLHENQLTYPVAGRADPEPEFAWVTWRNLVAADRVWVNSAHQRHELLAALPAFLAAVPDHDHLGMLAGVAERLEVLHLGVELADVPEAARRRSADGGRPLVLVNQRWDADKDPAAALRAVARCVERGLDVEVAVTGETDSAHRAAVTEALARLGDRVVVRGHLDRGDYVEVLGRADVVVSAARHEYFGIAVVEAVAAGAVPVLPAGLAHDEIIPARHHGWVLYGPGELTARLAATLADLARVRTALADLAGEVRRRFGWPTRVVDHDARVDAVVEAVGCGARAGPGGHEGGGGDAAMSAEVR